MLKKAFLTSIHVLGALLLPLAAYSHDASLLPSVTSKVVSISATKEIECLARAVHTCPVSQLQTHKPQRLLYSKLPSTVFITHVANLLKLPSLDSLEREVLNALRQSIFLGTRFQRAPPTKNYSIL